MTSCFSVGLKWTMTSWNSLTTCLILLSAVHADPALRKHRHSPESPLDTPPAGIHASAGDAATTAAGGAQYSSEELLPERFEDVVDFIRVTVSRIRRSTSGSTSSKLLPGSGTRRRREKKAAARSRRGGRGGARAKETGRKGRRGGGAGGGGGRQQGQGCVLKQIHLNVTDLGLGYQSGEEMIFRYCSGPCRKSDTNYDKILGSLVHSRRLGPRDTPLQACCRPIAFDDDLSFLDDNLIYHTVRRHSARKCGCV